MSVDATFPETGAFAIEPGVDDAPFWAGLRERRLLFQACAACGRFRHPPGPVCPFCRHPTSRWLPAPGPVVLYSWTIARGRPDSGWPDRYVIGLVRFPAANDVRLVTNIVAPEPEALTIDQPVELAWQPYGDLFLPRFRGLVSGGQPR